MSVLDKIMGIEDAAKKWGVSIRHAHILCSTGKVKSVLISGVYIIPLNEVYKREREKR